MGYIKDINSYRELLKIRIFMFFNDYYLKIPTISQFSLRSLSKKINYSNFSIKNKDKIKIIFNKLRRDNNSLLELQIYLQI